MKYTLEMERILLFGERDMTLKKYIEKSERKLILLVLRLTNGNRTRAALIFGITREGFHKKLRKYNFPLIISGDK